jgi:hypothetical protein
MSRVNRATLGAAYQNVSNVRFWPQADISNVRFEGPLRGALRAPTNQRWSGSNQPEAAVESEHAVDTVFDD